MAALTASSRCSRRRQFRHNPIDVDPSPKDRLEPLQRQNSPPREQIRLALRRFRCQRRQLLILVPTPSPHPLRIHSLLRQRHPFLCKSTTLSETLRLLLICRLLAERVAVRLAVRMAVAGLPLAE